MFTEEAKTELKKRSNLPERFWHVTYDRTKDRNKLVEYCYKAGSSFLESPAAIWLSGGLGIGKTYGAAVYMDAYIDAVGKLPTAMGYDTHYLTTQQLVKMYQTDKAGYQKVLRKILVILDDFGVPFSTKSWELDDAASIITEFYIDRLNSLKYTTIFGTTSTELLTNRYQRLVPTIEENNIRVIADSLSRYVQSKSKIDL